MEPSAQHHKVVELVIGEYRKHATGGRLRGRPSPSSIIMALEARAQGWLKSDGKPGSVSGNQAVRLAYRAYESEYGKQDLTKDQRQIKRVLATLASYGSAFYESLDKLYLPMSPPYLPDGSASATLVARPSPETPEAQGASLELLETPDVPPCVPGAGGLPGSMVAAVTTA
jgi:hypothetical protein